MDTEQYLPLPQDPLPDRAVSWIQQRVPGWQYNWPVHIYPTLAYEGVDIEDYFTLKDYMPSLKHEDAEFLSEEELLAELQSVCADYYNPDSRGLFRTMGISVCPDADKIARHYWRLKATSIYMTKIEVLVLGTSIWVIPQEEKFTSYPAMPFYGYKLQTSTFYPNGVRLRSSEATYASFDLIGNKPYRRYKDTLVSANHPHTSLKGKLEYIRGVISNKWEGLSLIHFTYGLSDRFFQCIRHAQILVTSLTGFDYLTFGEIIMLGLDPLVFDPGKDMSNLGMWDFEDVKSLLPTHLTQLAGFIMMRYNYSEIVSEVRKASMPSYDKSFPEKRGSVSSNLKWTNYYTFWIRALGKTFKPSKLKEFPLLAKVVRIAQDAPIRSIKSWKESYIHLEEAAAIVYNNMDYRDMFDKSNVHSMAHLETLIRFVLAGGTHQAFAMAEKEYNVTLLELKTLE
jgi:hypothetical protein